ncbi:MAG: hypothetical protein ACE5E5_06850 [Phycisphaerae bacterium]
MSDLQTPNPYGDGPAADAIPQAAPWSKAAVVGFGASFCGCTIVGSLIGLILGIVGIVMTGGGTRRGRGLAIAAIPISLLTGVVGAYMGLGIYAYSRMAHIVGQIPAALNEADPAAAAAKLRKLASDDFKDQVSVSDLAAWVAGAREAHGKLVSMKPDQNDPGGPTKTGWLYLNYEGKFVNGDASVRIFFNAESVLSDASIVNLEIDGKAIRAIDDAP